MIIPQWFFSRTVRHAVAMRKHVEKLLNHQRDILPQPAVEGIEAAIRDLQQAIEGQGDKPALEAQMENLEKAANKWLKPYPNAAWRENVEVLLVALTVAMGIRTFFLQPFKIPTGSMQPTLYGVTSVNLKNKPEVKMPSGMAAVREWFQGISYIHKVAASEGTLDAVDPPFGIRIINFWQTLVVGGKTYTIWFPPDYGEQSLETRAGLHRGQTFTNGEDIIKLKVAAGDHLFVDRVAYNFRPPERGEIVVFETKGIPEERRLACRIPPDQFYIKRLVGLGGETITLKQEFDVTGFPPGNPNSVPVGQLTVNGQALSAASPHFENLYSFTGAARNSKALQYQENHYLGHAMIGELSPGHEFHIGTNDDFVMGDNTMNSLDSRYWGGFSRSSVIGKAFFVYWPITTRFGWGYN